MNEESPRKSLVKGERFVRHDDTSEGVHYKVSALPTTFDLTTLLAVVASLNLRNKKKETKMNQWILHSWNLVFDDVGTLSGFRN